MKRHFPLLTLLLFISTCSEPEKERSWRSIERDLQIRLIMAPDSSVIELPEGAFMFTKSLLIEGKSMLTVRGQGIEKTILSFAQQEEGAEGIRAANCTGIILEDFAIEDASGDNIKVTDSRDVVFRRVKSIWSGEPNEENGAYAFYPVLSKNVLIEECIAIGASDAGIYVGQSDSVLIRNNEAYMNVAGIESENSRWVEIYGNYAHDNTGGILVFDLPGLTQYGHTTRVYDNRVIENNYRNFAPAGNIVATVPPGTGIMLLATRTIEISGNEIVNNQTAGTAIVSYDLVEALGTEKESQLNENIETAQKDENYDPYPDEVFIHDNRYANDKWVPTLKNDFGWLFLVKFPFGTPDIVWDGIVPDRETFDLCIRQESVKFADLDAANDFENLSTDMSPFVCDGIVVAPIF